MLSQVASITLPADTLEKMYKGEDLTAEDQEMVDRLPDVAESLLTDIPRIDEVRRILRYLTPPLPNDSADFESAVLGSKILKAVMDLDVLESQGVPETTALEMIRNGPELQDSRLLLALGSVFDANEEAAEIRDLYIRDLKSGMVLVDAVEGTDGRLLVAHGQEVSVGLLERLKNFSKNMGVKEPLRVMIPAAVADPEHVESGS